jgi:hypothetical protein
MGEEDRLLEDLRRRVSLAPRRPTGVYDKPTAHPPATAAEIAHAENELGFRLPPLLRRLYAEVADGGFGPSYGLLPIARRHVEPGQDETLVEVRNKLATDPRWPAELVPLCDWGCAIWSCLDCRTTEGPMVTVAGEEPFTSTGMHLRGWLRAWLAGTDLWSDMFEPGPTRTGTNPFTHEPVEMKGQGKPKGRPWP